MHVQVTAVVLEMPFSGDVSQTQRDRSGPRRDPDSKHDTFSRCCIGPIDVGPASQTILGEQRLVSGPSGKTDKLVLVRRDQKLEQCVTVPPLPAEHALLCNGRSGNPHWIPDL